MKFMPNWKKCLRRMTKMNWRSHLWWWKGDVTVFAE